MSTGYATVKGVLTGDTLLLMGRSASNGPPPELQLTLSGVNAPRLARGSGSTDEPFAWAARDYLRKHCLGKTVSFRVDAKGASAGARQYGSVWTQPKTAGGPPESVAAHLVKAGWCSRSASPTTRTSRRGGRGQGRGFRPAHGRRRGEEGRRAQGPVDGRGRVFLGSTARGIVEFVRDGSNLKCLVVTGEPSEMAMVNVQLAGVRCGKVPFRAPAKENKENGDGDNAAAAQPPLPPPEPFALEAKHFVETRLLHREVTITFCGADKFGNALGCVSHAASGAKIGVAVLKEGLGKVQEMGMGAVDPSEASSMRAAESAARGAKLRVWKGYAKPNLGNIDADFEGVVVEVVSGDQVVVLSSSGTEARVSLSSIKAPRLGNAKQSRKEEPWSPESKEALRHACIGKRCRVLVEYVREIPVGSADEGKTMKLKDVGEALVALGLAAVTPPRNSDERAGRYEQLVAAETDAKAKKLRLWSGKAPPPPPKVADLATRSARTFLPSSSASGPCARRWRPSSGSRFKVKVASEGCVLVLALAGCRSPSASSAARPQEEFAGDAAKAFSRATLLQRTVDVSVADMDRNGVGLGGIRLLPEDAKRSRNDLAALGEGGGVKMPAVDVDDDSFESRLLARGFADRYRSATRWAKLEATAKDLKLGLWADEKNREEAEKVAEPKEPPKAKTFRAKVADITDGSSLHLAEVTEAGATPKLDAVLAKMAGFAGAADPAATYWRNAVVAAKFDDGSGAAWYRAKVLEVDKEAKTYKIKFLDFGNVDYGDLTVTEVFVRGAEKKMVALKLASAGDDDKTVNERLVEAGLARLPKGSKYAKDDLATKLKALQEAARSSRAGVWRYGDCDFSDDEK
ncbi:hypothetical protein JL722_13173 [Aureococcus anophagefferens]|nr:hypothetical protein JL722_13173 [Aureococcus anophagefferens]